MTGMEVANPTSRRRDKPARTAVALLLGALSLFAAAPAPADATLSGLELTDAGDDSAISIGTFSAATHDIHGERGGGGFEREGDAHRQP